MLKTHAAINQDITIKQLVPVDVARLVTARPVRDGETYTVTTGNVHGRTNQALVKAVDIAGEIQFLLVKFIR